MFPRYAASRLPAAFAAVPLVPPRPAGRVAVVRPAGQVDSIFFQPCLPGETQSACDARARARQASLSGSTLSGFSSGSGGGLSPQAQSALFGAIGTALGTTGTAIAAAFNSGAQVEMERIRRDAETRLAQINAEAAATTAPLRAAELAAQREQFNQFLILMQQRQSGGDNTALYVVGGVLALGLIGTVIYLAVRR